jgi:hypothetical protein
LQVARSWDARPPAGDALEAIAAALEATRRHLRFGLQHPTDLRFEVAEREAHCQGYAQLFAALFDRLARRSGLEARAQPVRSGARLLGWWSAPRAR